MTQWFNFTRRPRTLVWSYKQFNGLYQLVSMKILIIVSWTWLTSRDSCQKLIEFSVGAIMHSYTSTSFFFGIICKLIRWFNCERVLIICLYYKYELAYKSACRACVFKVCEPPKGELILQIELVQFQTCTRSAIHLLLASMACYSMICAFNIIIGVYGVSEYTARLSNVFVWRKKKCILIRISKRHYLIFVIRVYPSSYT